MKNSVYITAAIDYSNGNPHLGHALEKIGVDALARYHRLRGRDVRLLVGTDEHSQNVVKRAEAAQLTPLDYCNKMATVFQSAYDKLQISYSRFIRTTDRDHFATVRWISEKIFKTGAIQKGTYEGAYCVSCETFYQDKDLLQGTQCPVHKRDVTRIQEENYFFQLSRYQKQLLEHIHAHPEFIQPDFRRNEVLRFLEEPLQDLSISRSTTTWGIPLPFDEKAVAYVWFDALTNYLTGVGPVDSPLYQQFWPANAHVVGKDISRFHCVIWPIMLLSAGLPLPKTVWVHGFLNLGGEKMSKSTGTIVDPLELADLYGVYPLRYFLMKEIPFHRDGEFTLERLVESHNADLSNGVGNLFSRSVSLIHKGCGGQVALSASLEPDLEKTWELLESSVKTYCEHFEAFMIHEAAHVTTDLVRHLNLLIDQKKPWAMAKDPSLSRPLADLLHTCLSGVALLAEMLSPLIPDKATELSRLLAAETGLVKAGSVASLRRKTWQPGAVAPLFPRLELKS